MIGFVSIAFDIAFIFVSNVKLTYNNYFFLFISKELFTTLQFILSKLQNTDIYIFQLEKHMKVQKSINFY